MRFASTPNGPSKNLSSEYTGRASRSAAWQSLHRAPCLRLISRFENFSGSMMRPHARQSSVLVSGARTPKRICRSARWTDRSVKPKLSKDTMPSAADCSRCSRGGASPAINSRASRAFSAATSSSQYFFTSALNHALFAFPASCTPRSSSTCFPSLRIVASARFTVGKTSASHELTRDRSASVAASDVASSDVASSDVAGLTATPRLSRLRSLRLMVSISSASAAAAASTRVDGLSLCSSGCGGDDDVAPASASARSPRSSSALAAGMAASSAARSAAFAASKSS
mmetsp:Transcript_18433/g.63973  ORF Transcript_18433/g.63973 Transcript_18433/m.63973 type:complete len:285 (-) Transcript_18433:443-1297(-)